VTLAVLVFYARTNMNNTKIEWCDYSWNPITGCLRKCIWCYAERLYHRFHRSFKPEFHPERLNEPLKIRKPAKIFTCSVADFFAVWTREEWRQEVYQIMNRCPQHVFLVLTQDPQNIPDNPDLPKNIWVGTTVRDQSEIVRVDIVKKKDIPTKFVSFEPLLGNIEADLSGIQWVIIGAMTGVLRNKYKVKEEWVDHLVHQAREKNVPVFIKDNLSWKESIKEFPVS